MKKKCVFKQPNPETVAFLSKQLAVSMNVATLLVNRGIEDLGEAKIFVSGTFKDIPSPYLMKDMKKAVDRILRAIDQKESIFIYGDYDVDGVTATSCLYNFFSELGVEVGYHIPHRLKEGYGLHVKALEAIKKKGGQVVITADCGISNVREAEAATALGIDLIITDHHIIPPKLPDAHAVLNPLREDSDYPDLFLSGCGVAFQFMIAIRSTLREKGFFKSTKEPNLRNYLDLVALGTIADLVPLRGVNHILVKEGLRVLSQRGRPGIKALAEVSGIKKDEIGTYEVAFQLAPRLNAGGRVSRAETGVKLLTSEDYYAAIQNAQQLDAENSRRRTLQQQILDHAIQMVEENSYHKNHVIVLSSPHWHPGVIGIVASKLVEKYYRPTIMIAETDGVETPRVGKGSARSIKDLHLVNAFKECADLFENYGGHKAAAGFSIKVDKIDELRARLEQIISGQLSPEDFVPKIHVDLKMLLEDVDESFLQDLSKLAPFGMGNPEPVIMTDRFSVKNSRLLAEKHLKLWLESDTCQREAIGFNMGECYRDAHKVQEIIYSPTVNEWQGRRSIQLKLKELSF